MRSPLHLLSLFVITAICTLHPAGAVWWDPWTWFEKEWRPITGLKPTEVRDAGYFTVAQHNYNLDYNPPDVVKFVRVVGGRYRDVDDIRREFELLIQGVGHDRRARNYDTRMFRIVPAARSQLVGTVSDRYAYSVVKFEIKYS